MKTYKFTSATFIDAETQEEAEEKYQHESISEVEDIEEVCGVCRTVPDGHGACECCNKDAFGG